MSNFITEGGINPKTYNEIKSEKEAKARSLFGSAVDLSSYSPIGLLLQLEAYVRAEQHKDLEDTYYGLNVNTATGVQLDRYVAGSGLIRRDATRAIVTLTISGDNGTIVPIGFIAQTQAGVAFSTTESGEISGGSVDLEAECLKTGEVGNVGVGTIIEINTPQSGVDSVTNATEARGGAPRETDPELRERYKIGDTRGGSSVDSIRANLLQIDGVISAYVNENVADITDSDGIPPHTIRALIDSAGVSEEIFDVFLRFKPAGIGTRNEGLSGEQSVSGVDRAGEPVTYYYYEPVLVDIYVIVNITQGSDWDSGSVDAVKQAVVKEIGGTWGASTYKGGGIAHDVKGWRIIGQIDQDGIGGIDDINVLVGRSDPPADQVVDINATERARTDSAKIVVNVT
jgi:uncharacterized phage protein gp47/JayE